MNYRSYSSERTKKLGQSLAKKILSKGPGKGARVVALSGDLGSGKTTFVQGFMRGLGLRGAKSPTFVIMRRSGLKKDTFKNVFHLDAYRLKDEKALSVLGFADLTKEPENIIIVEWADIVRKALPRKSLKVAFKHGGKPNERLIKIK